MDLNLSNITAYKYRIHVKIKCKQKVCVFLVQDNIKYNIIRGK